VSPFGGVGLDQIRVSRLRLRLVDKRYLFVNKECSVRTGRFGFEPLQRLILLQRQ